MKILFWLEPHFELTQPGVMNTWLVWFERMVIALNLSDVDFDFRLVCLDSPSAKEHSTTLGELQILLSQPELLLEWKLAGNAFMELEHDRVPRNLCAQLVKGLRKRLRGFEPDVVFLLNQQPWLRRAFADSLFVNIELSWASRAPFPCCWQLDISGAGKGRVLADYSSEILDAQMKVEDIKKVEEVRLIARDRLMDSGAESFVQSIRDEYKEVRLLPLGAFDRLDGATSCFTMLDKFLSEQDGSSAIILVRHPMWQPLKDDQLAYLLNKYPYVWDGDPFGSQFLLPWVDYVVGDFSTVATQALLFETQVISACREFYNFPVDTPLLNPLIDLLANATASLRDNALYWLLYHYAVPERRLFDGNWLGRFLRRAIDAVKASEPWAAYEEASATFEDWSESNWRSLPERGGVVSEAKLYISEVLDGVPTSFSEHRSVGKLYSISGQRQSLKLLMPKDVMRLARIRLDVANVPMAFLLHGLSLVDSEGVELWCWDGIENTFQNCGGLVIRKGEAGLFVLSLGNDPYFDIRVPSECLALVCANTALVVEFTALSLLDVVPEVLVQDDLILAELRSKCDSLNALPSKALGSNSGLSKLTSDLDGLAILFKDSLNKRDNRIKEQTVQLDKMRDELTRAEAQLDLLKDLMLEGRPKDRL